MKKILVFCLLLLFLAVPALALEKNVASQKWVVFCFDDTDNSAKTSDAAQITANLWIDGVQNAVDDTNPTELEDGYYVFDITDVESNGENILICPDNSTADIQCIGCPMALWTRPPAHSDFPAPLTAAETESEVDDALGGGTGTALTAIPWNSSWDTEVQSECDDALTNLNLDHLCKIAVDTNWATTVHLDSVIGHIADDGTAATFNRVGDSLEDLRDQGDAAWVTATGFATSGAMTTAQNDLDVITGASGVVIQDGTLVAASFGADCITSAKIADNAIAAEHIAAAAIDNATFAADVGSTAHATNIISQAARKGLDDYDPPTKGEMDTAHGLLATPTQVNAQVSDVLKTDTISELSVGAPAATPSFEDAIMLMYMDFRNANETTASEYRIKNNAGTNIAESDLSDAAGTTTFGELRAPN